MDNSEILQYLAEQIRQEAITQADDSVQAHALEIMRLPRELQTMKVDDWEKYKKRTIEKLIKQRCLELARSI